MATNRLVDFTSLQHQEATVWGVQSGKNLEFLKELEILFDYLIKLCNKNAGSVYFKKGKDDVFNSGTFKDVSDNINKLLTDRFGVEIRGYYGTHGLTPYNAYCVVYQPRLQTLQQDYENLEKQVTELKSTMEETEKIDSVAYGQLTNLLDNLDKLKKQILSCKLSIDLKNIKFIDAGDAYIDLAVDVPSFALDPAFELTSKEIIAIMLHEVGHAFESIHGLNTEFLSNNNLYEEIEHIASKCNSLKEVMKIVYKNEKGKIEGSENIDKSSDIMVLVKYSKYVLSKVDERKFTGRLKTRTVERELEADKFAAAFHTGADLTTGLLKLHKGFGKHGILMAVLPISPHMRWMVRFTLVRLIILGIRLTFSYYTKFLDRAPITISKIALYVFASKYINFTPYLVFSICTDAIIGILSSAVMYNITESPEKQAYRSLPNRLGFIRNQCVKNLKKLDRKKDKQLYDYILAEIEEIDKATKYISSGLTAHTYISSDTHVTGGFIYMLQSYLSRNLKNSIELQNLELRMEDMINNDLYVASGKLQSAGDENA